ncbi:hypothetical protein G7013_24835 [Pseudomonas viridiflava]|uniref:hypothetical protein n=1 Tax=Pseudomonas viridiflava TaxID=33069 RepID=UPI0015E3ED90|nr:hypothetical protein [Pseudomonas viridiflava]MBA1232880.1 hypothetical protein [Pseudomonas viridiflava]
MKADASDAPARITRRHPKHSAFWTITCLVIGSITTVGALQLISRVPNVDSAKSQTMSRTERDVDLTRATGMPTTQGSESSWLRASSGISLPANTDKQNVFNDQNFVPRGADNIVAFQINSAPYQEKEAPKKAKLTVVRQARSMKDRVCWPYRQGSIEFRNCRASIGLKYRD